MKLFRWVIFLLGVLFGAYYSVWIPEVLARGFDLAQVATLIGARIIFSTICDLPTGMLADRIGHKTVSLIGFVIISLAILTPNLNPSPMAVALAVIIFGIGEAFLSGALDVWGADLGIGKSVGSQTKDFIFRDQLQRFGMILGAITLPALSQFASGYNSRVSSIWGILLVVTFVLIAIAKATPDGISHKEPAEKSSVLKSRMFKDSGFLLLSGGWLLFGVSDTAVELSFQPKMIDMGIKSLAYFGVFQAVMSTARMMGGELWKRSGLVDRFWIPGAALAISSAPFFAFAFSEAPFSAIYIWMLRVAALSAYFSTVTAMVLRVPQFAKHRASVIGLSGVIAVMGKLIASGIASVFEMNLNQIIWIGSIASALGGLALIVGFKRMLIPSSK